MGTASFSHILLDKQSQCVHSRGKKENSILDERNIKEF